jgi:hypothetical protein
MRTSTLVLAASLVLFPLAISGAVSAAPLPVNCSATLNVWYATYSCFVEDAGAAGVVVWCPIANACAGTDILVCSGPLLAPCTVLP